MTGLSSGFHTCVTFISLVHCHGGGVAIDDVQEKVGGVVVGLTLVACGDRVRTPGWGCVTGQGLCLAVRSTATHPTHGVACTKGMADFGKSMLSRGMSGTAMQHHQQK